MGNNYFRALLDVLMCSDPWDANPEAFKKLEQFADGWAKTLGFTDWIDAYHNHKAG